MPNNNNGLPFECEKEITPFDPRISIRVSATVYEAEGNRPVDVILSNQDWYVILEWQLDGKLVDHLCGYFCPRLHIECYGAATERSYGPAPNPREGYNLDVENGLVKMDPCKEDLGHYHVRIDVPAGAIQPFDRNADDCGTMCCLGLTLQSRDLCNKPGHINVVCEGPCIGFFDAAHFEDEPTAAANG